MIAEAMPPAPVVGSFRAAKVACAFRDQGHAVHILTRLGGDADEAGDSGVFAEGITWQRVRPWPGPKQWYSAVSRPFKRAFPAPADRTPSGTAVSGGRPGLRGFASALITLPDERQGLVPAVARAVQAKRGWPDLIYATAPAFSVLLAGRAAHGRLGVPWIAELRDPWVGSPGREARTSSSIIGRLDTWLESSCLRTAAGIVMVTPLAAAEYSRRYSPFGVPVLSALNGIDEVQDGRTPASRESIHIVYAGSVYPPRNPAPLVAALGDALRDGHLRLPVRFTFVGSSGWAGARGLEEAVSALPNEVMVERIPWVPQADARALVNGADLLLLPAQEWVLQVPNKLYDYLGSRVPVLAIAEPGSDTDTMLRQAGGHFVARPDDPATRLRQIAAAALEAAASGQAVGDSARLREWSAHEQMRGLIQQVAGLVRGQPLRAFSA